MENNVNNGLEIANEVDLTPTYYSCGVFEDKEGNSRQKSSVLDHVYYRVFPPLHLQRAPQRHHGPPANLVHLQHGTAVLGPEEHVLPQLQGHQHHHNLLGDKRRVLSRVFAMNDVEEIDDTIIHKITAALDIVAPVELIQVKEGRTPIYLSMEARLAINERDRAAACGSHDDYRKLRNHAARLVRRDKLSSNFQLLQKEDFSSKAIWQMVNTVWGRSTRSSLPAELVDE